MIRKNVYVKSYGNTWVISIPQDLAKELPKDVIYCEVYYSIRPRIIVLEFTKYRTEDSYQVYIAYDKPKQINLSLLLKSLGLYPGTVSKYCEVRNNTLIIYWDDVVPLDQVKLNKLTKLEKLPTIKVSILRRPVSYTHLTLPTN